MAFVPYLDSSCPVSRVGGVMWLDFWSVGHMGWPLCHILFSHFGGFFASVRHPFPCSILFRFVYLALKANVFMEFQQSTRKGIKSNLSIYVINRRGDMN